MKRNALILLLLLAAIGGSFYLAYPLGGEPAEFPNDQAIRAMITELRPETGVREVQGIFFLDNSHAYVPFISDKGRYSSSFWIWSKNKWRIARISDNGGPDLWMVNPKDPATYYFVWNFAPAHQIAEIHYYFIERRNYSVHYGVHHYYYPRIQLETVKHLEESYGILALPKDWVRVIKALNEVQQQSRQFGFNSYDEDGEIKYPITTGSSSSSTYLNLNMTFVPILNESELEY